MNRILSVRRTATLALGLAVAVLGAGWWLPDPAGRGADYGLAEAAALSGKADLDAAVDRPARRLRASSTMPYFSFAQSLRSRG